MRNQDAVSGGFLALTTASLVLLCSESPGLRPHLSSPRTAAFYSRPKRQLIAESDVVSPRRRHRFNRPAVLDLPVSVMIVSSRYTPGGARQCAACHSSVSRCWCPRHVASRLWPQSAVAKPSKPPAARETICQLQSPCRPVREGCHLERIGQYNEEVCKQGGGRNSLHAMFALRSTQLGAGNSQFSVRGSKFVPLGHAAGRRAQQTRNKIRITSAPIAHSSVVMSRCSRPLGCSNPGLQPSLVG